MASVLDLYAASSPNPQQTIDIFKGEWATVIPGLQSGIADLSNDPRIAWANDKLGLENKTILELGPLEATHTRLLLELGAKNVTAIEGNSHHFLKCLIIKELYKLDNANFLYGDFVKYLHETTNRFDMILASGVLYHMNDPIQLLSLIAQHTDRILIWTHYFDEQRLRECFPTVYEKMFEGETLLQAENFQCIGHTQHYGVGLDNPTFCGGTRATSTWLTRQDILKFLASMGFTYIDTSHESNTIHGPAFTIAAARG